MNKIDFIKKYTNWKNVVELPKEKFSVYYDPAINIKKKIGEIMHIYTSDSLDDWIIVETNSFCYIGELVNDEIICFGECDTLKEACESL